MQNCFEFKRIILTAPIVILSASLSHGAPLVYEGFNYGATDVAVNGITTNATGLTGDCTSATGTSGDGNIQTSNYTATGLSFRPLHWCDKAEASAIHCLKQMAKTIRTRIEGLLAFGKNDRLTSASQEGFNNKIGWLTGKLMDTGMKNSFT